MTEPQAKKPPIVALTERVKSLEVGKVTYRAATVVAVHPLSSTFDADVAGAGRLSGISSPPHFLPAVGDEVQLSMSGALPTYQPGRVASGAIGEDELSGEVTESITNAYTAANGKNKVWFSTAAASLSIPGTTKGDLWFQEDIYGLGLIVNAWEWVTDAWAPRTFNDSVLNSLTVGKLVSGTGTFDMLMAGSIHSGTSGSRYRIDSTGIKLWSGAGTTPTVDLNAITGNATFRGTVEGALIRTSSTGQRLEIQGGGTAGGRTLTFYPAGAGAPATLTSRDDGVGNAGLTLLAGPSTGRSFLNFNSTFADIGYGDSVSSQSWLRANSTASTFGLELTASNEMSVTTTRTRFFDGAYTYAVLSRTDGLNKVGKFSLLGPVATGSGSDVSAFTFGTMPGTSDADVYALRFISTNPGSTGGFVYFSDKRLKRNARPVKFDGLAEVLSIPVEEFEWVETGETSFGFQAQNMPADVQVRLSPDQPVGGIANPIGVASELLLAKMVKGFQQMHVKIVTLETELAALRGRAK